MAEKKKRRRRRRKDAQRLCSFLMDLNGNVSCTAVDVSMATHRRYLELHDTMLPEGVQRWSAEQLRAKVEIAQVIGRRQDWERALLLLAHHRSELACDLLREIEPQVPAALAGLHQLARGEALGWLGYDYVVDEQGRPRVLPAGMPWTPEGAN